MIMKSIIRILLRIIVLPALFVHELCHLLAALIIGVNPKNIGWSFFILNGPINAMVYLDEDGSAKLKTGFRKFIFDIAPIFAFIYIGYMAIHIEFFMYFLIYELVVFPFSFLSVVDLNNALKYLGKKKEINLFYNKWFEKFDNWLYYEGMTKQEYFKKYGFNEVES